MHNVKMSEQLALTATCLFHMYTSVLKGDENEEEDRGGGGLKMTNLALFPLYKVPISDGSLFVLCRY